MTAAISATSMSTIASVRIKVPSGSPSISARCSASVVTPNADHSMTARTKAKRRPSCQAGRPAKSDGNRKATATVVQATMNLSAVMESSRACPGVELKPRT